MDQKSSARGSSSGATVAGLLGLLKFPLLFAPFVFLHSCTLEGPHNSLEILLVGGVEVWPLILVPIAALVCVFLMAVRRSSAARWRSSLGLSVSALSFLGLAWTGWILARSPGEYAGELLWGFWALLACDIGAAGGHAYDFTTGQPANHLSP